MGWKSLKRPPSDGRRVIVAYDAHSGKREVWQGYYSEGKEKWFFEAGDEIEFPVAWMDFPAPPKQKDNQPR